MHAFVWQMTTAQREGTRTAKKMDERDEKKLKQICCFGPGKFTKKTLLFHPKHGKIGEGAAANVHAEEQNKKKKHKKKIRNNLFSFV